MASEEPDVDGAGGEELVVGDVVRVAVLVGCSPVGVGVGVWVVAVVSVFVWLGVGERVVRAVVRGLGRSAGAGVTWPPAGAVPAGGGRTSR